MVDTLPVHKSVSFGYITLALSFFPLPLLVWFSLFRCVHSVEPDFDRTLTSLLRFRWCCPCPQRRSRRAIVGLLFHTFFLSSSLLLFLPKISSFVSFSQSFFKIIIPKKFLFSSSSSFSFNKTTIIKK